MPTQAYDELNDFNERKYTKNFNFEDLKILKNCQLDYKFLACIDLILIDGFLVLIKASQSVNYFILYFPNPFTV